jgi:ribonuclease P protein component
LSGDIPSAGQRFDRSCRLLVAAEYADVFAARKMLQGERFALHYRPTTGKAAARLGLVIPKKQARTAVLRNAIKRQARELFRQRRTALPAFDLLVRLAKPIRLNRAIDGADKARWREELGRLLDKMEGLGREALK